jgi:hypothetical protein
VTLGIGVALTALAEPLGMDRACKMAKTFKIGDHVGWNSEAGWVTGTIVAIHTKNFHYTGFVHHASEDDPQYEIKSDKTDHIAAHKGAALEHVPGKGKA